MQVQALDALAVVGQTQHRLVVDLPAALAAESLQSRTAARQRLDAVLRDQVTPRDVHLGQIRAAVRHRLQTLVGDVHAGLQINRQQLRAVFAHSLHRDVGDFLAVGQIQVFDVVAVLGKRSESQG